MNYLLTCFLFFIGFYGLSQGLSKSELEQLEYEELLEYYDRLDYDSIQGEIVARVYLERARREKDTIKMARGYDRLARLFHPEKNIAFADSIIALTEHMNHITYPGLGYIMKAVHFKESNHLEKAHQFFYLAHEFAIKNKNLSLQTYTVNILAASKSNWGNKEEALEMIQTHIALLERENSVDKLSFTLRKEVNVSPLAELKEHLFRSYVILIICHLNLGDVHGASEAFEVLEATYIEYEGRRKEEFHLITLQCLNEILYYSKEYREAISISDSILAFKQPLMDDSVKFDALLFKGVSKRNLTYNTEGNFELLQAHDIMKNNQVSILPYRRMLYTHLLNYYKSKDDVKMQIQTLNKLLEIDSLFKKRYLFVDSDLINRFETPILLAEKENLIIGLQSKNKKSNFWIILVTGVLLLISIALFYYVDRQRSFKKRYLELKNAKQQRPNMVSFSDSKEKSEISTDVIDEILMQLERFERKREYLSTEVNLHDLAKSFNSNPNYLSRVINLKMEKNFTQYLNDLRINYAVKILKSDAKMRRYSIKAIANECGFKGASSFSRAFYKLNGIYPSFYLKQLDKEAG